MTPDRQLVRTRIRAPMSRRARPGSDAEPPDPATPASPPSPTVVASELTPAPVPASIPPPKPTSPSTRTTEGRAHSETVEIGAEEAVFGLPPQMPQTSAPPPLALGGVENPTHMPGPKHIPGGEPDDPAPAPGRVPPGDSRSFRRGNEFALVYRVGTYVICRFGNLGKRGQWRVIEYPTSSSAGNYYARECSRFVTEGFSDYRE